MQKSLIRVAFGSALLLAASASMAQLQPYDAFSFYRDRLAAAKQHCGTDTVLWLNTKTGAISKPGTSDYGTTESGHYVCEHNQNQGLYGTEAEPTTTTTQPK
ncbi:MAG TPA: hypothetical protein VMU22_00710 [Rhizomicrobium sp.]|nr:hypothetical protein [Rhizomicrobium sp.]